MPCSTLGLGGGTIGFSPSDTTAGTTSCPPGNGNIAECHWSSAPLVGGYRPSLDGVRAIAVLMVLVQHVAGPLRIDLGYTGVGLFFGLSGYLITSLLLDEFASRGRVSLFRFYARRAARLVPALLLVVAVCNTIFVIQGYYAPLAGSLTALTYTANYVQIFNLNWMVAYGPTWSLAVEEHFYIIWPLALLATIRR